MTESIMAEFLMISFYLTPFIYVHIFLGIYHVLDTVLDFRETMMNKV